MATVSLAKPGTAGTAVLQIVRGDNVVKTMNLKLQACDISYTQVVEDTTGGTDTVADGFHTHEGSSLLGGTIALQGLLVSVADVAVGSGNDYVGIENMYSTTDVLCRMRWSVHTANAIYFRGSMIVEKTTIRWVRTAATVQITIAGRITDTAPSATEAVIPFAPP